MPTLARRPAAQHERERLQARQLGAAELVVTGVHQAQVVRQLEVSAQAVSLWYGRFKAGEPRPAPGPGRVRSRWSTGGGRAPTGCSPSTPSGSCTLPAGRPAHASSAGI
jgi:hypothetical protein